MTILLLEVTPPLVTVAVSARAPLSEPAPPVIQANINSTPISLQITAGLAAINAALALIPSLQNATAAQVVPLHNATHTLLAQVQSALLQYDADIITTSVAGLVPGIAAPQLWPILLNQDNDSQQIAILLNLRGYLSRIERNIHSVLGPELADGLPGDPDTLQ